MSTEQKTYKDLSDEDQQLLNKYRSMTLNEMLRIKPIWNRNGQGTGTVVEVSPSALIRKCYDLDMPADSLFNDDARDIWFAKNLEKWEKGVAVNPPDVALHNDDLVVINDGKHRAILAYYFGMEALPVEVPAADAEQVRGMLQ